MAINEYMSPKQDQFYQTYVSQYIPLPFEQMQASVERAQKSKDQVEETGLGIKDLLTKVEARPGVQGQLGPDEILRNNIINNYDAQLNSILESSGGDLRKVKTEVESLARTVQKDLTRGDLGQIHSRALERKNMIERGQEAGLRGDVLSGMINRVDEEYTGLGGYGAGANNILHEWSKDIPNITERIYEYAEPIKAKIEETLADPRKAVDDEGNQLPGYYVNYKNKRTFLTKDDIRNVLGSAVEGDKELGASIAQAMKAGVDDSEALEAAMTAAGLTFDRDDIEKNRSFLSDKEWEVGSKRRETYRPLLNIKGDVINKTTNKTQSDMTTDINNAHKEIATIIKDPELMKNPNIINKFKSDQQFVDYINTVLKDDPEYTTKYNKVMESYRQSKLIKGQRNYEFNEYYNTPQGEAEINKVKKSLQLQGIPLAQINDLFNSAESLGWIQSALTSDNIDEAREDFINNYTRVMGGTGVKKIAEQAWTTLYKNSTKIRESITQIREDVDAYARTNKLNKQGYQPKVYGTPTGDASSRSEMDNHIRYVSKFFETHPDALTMKDENGEDIIATTKIKALQDGMGGDGEAVETFYLFTSDTPNTGMYQVVVKTNKGKVSDPIYVYENNHNAENSITNSWENAIKKQIEGNKKAGVEDEDLEKLQKTVQVRKKYKSIDIPTVVNTLQGLDESGGHIVPDPRNPNNRITISFKKIYEPEKEKAPRTKNEYYEVVTGISSDEYPEDSPLMKESKKRKRKVIGLGMYNNRGELLYATANPENQAEELLENLYDATLEYQK